MASPRGRRPRRRRPQRSRSPQRSRRSHRPRRPSRDDSGVLVTLVMTALAVAVLWHLARAAWQWLVVNWDAGVVLLGIVVVLGVSATKEHLRTEQGREERLRRLSLTLEDIDDMTPRDFELACAELLRRDGLDARHVGGSNDQAADVIADDPGGRRVVVQCKHTTCGGRVGVGVLYAVNGTAGPIHGASIAIIATNGGFTSEARQLAPRFGIHLVGRDHLARWADGGDTLYFVLGIEGPVHD